MTAPGRRKHHKRNPVPSSSAGGRHAAHVAVGQEDDGRIQSPADDGLVRFDRKAVSFLASLLALVALTTVLKLHGSSIAVWNSLLNVPTADAGVLMGTPKAIRSDEWAVVTPEIISQVRSHPPFPTINRGWGQGPVPLLASLPVRHWSAIFRPRNWGFMILELERGFAFYWNFQTSILLSGLFLLFMLLTGNDFGVALLGTAWVFFSGFMQWWYSTPLPEMVGWAALGVVAAHYVALSSSRRTIAAWSLVLVTCLIGCALLLYPPFQLPLLYFGVAVLIGSVGPRFANVTREHLVFRIACGAAVVVATAVVLVLYYRDAKPAVDLMRGTVYPGARAVTGGDITVAEAFGGFYGFFMSEGRVPPATNVCEASNFVLLFPVPMAVVLWRARRRLPVSPLEWSLVFYVVVMFVWITVGFARPIALASGFSMTQPSRAQLGLGIGSVVLCCVFLARRRVDLPRSSGGKVLVVVMLFALLLVHGWTFNKVTNGFATQNEILLISVTGAAAGYLLLGRMRAAFIVCVLAPLIWTYGLVNPIAVGLGPILDETHFQRVSQIVEGDPSARWAYYGNSLVANLLKAAGANVVNGTKMVPPLDDLRIIDREGTAASTYNRYAHISLVPATGPTVRFNLQAPDAYLISIDPNSESWRQLEVRYIVLPVRSTDPGFLGHTTLLHGSPGFWIYRQH